MSKSQEIGHLGEVLVGSWLQSQGYQILHHQWHCRYGELDLIALGSASRLAQETEILVFVEVKTRSRRNWDEGGLLAITSTKQKKIIQSAQLFLSDRPDLAILPCRFDVALVRCDRNFTSNVQNSGSPTIPLTVELGKPVQCLNAQLILQTYIESAFHAWD